MLTANPLEPLDRRVLVLLPLGRDAELACATLEEAGFPACAVPNMASLCREIEAGAGAVLLGHEATASRALPSLVRLLQQQPPWSDLPLVVFSQLGEPQMGTARAEEELARLGNVTLIDRPVRRETLVSTISAVLRARMRQYGARRQLAQQAFLAEATAVLGSSLDLEIVFDRFVRASVPRLADACVVRLGAEDEHSANRVFVAGLSGLSPELPRGPSGPGAVVYRDLSSTLSSNGSDPYLPFLRSVGARSAVILPLGTGRQGGDHLILIGSDPGRRYEEDDLAFLEELAWRISLSVENASLYASLKAAVELRDQFLSIAGHELKTPLAALLMHVQSLERLVDPEGRVGQRLRKAGGAGARLETLINQLLDVSRITAGRLQLEPERVDLGELVREVVERQAVTPSNNLLAVHAQEGVHGYWDRFRLDQVITNLLTNAMKYGGGKPVEVHVRQEAGWALIRVVDHGIGIAPEQQVRIFQRFERVVQSREYGGFGLGLWIARQIVDASGGRIEVESHLGQGATFTVTLPAMLPREETPRAIA